MSLLSRFRGLIIAAGVFLLLAVLVHLFRTGQVFATYWEPANIFADRCFEFLNDWATVLSASMTLLLAVAALLTLFAMREQRQKSIKPILCLTKIGPTWQHFNLRQFDPPLIVKDPKLQGILAPNFFLEVSNLGKGAAVGLDVSAEAAIEFIREDSQESIIRKLHFNLARRSGDEYIEPTVEKPRELGLNLVKVEDLNATHKAGSAVITFTFSNIDGHPYMTTTSYQLSTSEYQFSARDDTILPGDAEYPTDWLTPA